MECERRDEGLASLLGGAARTRAVTIFRLEIAKPSRLAITPVIDAEGGVARNVRT
jgi:hypothetical protein